MGKLVQIRDVPDDVHRRLKARAAEQGTSLSEYLRQELERVAKRPTLDEVLERIDKLEPVELSEPPAETIRRMRDAGS